MELPTPAAVLELSLESLAALGVDVEVTDEGLATPDGKVFGLEPLRRRLAAAEPDEWPGLVRRHFDLLMAVDPEMPGSFEEAAPNLRAAVIADVDLGLFDGAIMERPLVDGLGERLMLRRGSLGMTVTAEACDDWAIGPAAVWERARQNAIWDEPIHRQRFGPRPVGYTAIRGGRWTSTQVLDLNRHLTGAAAFGALVAVPARDEVLVHQIRDEAFTDAAMAMLSHTVDSYAQAPLPVGCDLFWWSGTQLSRICTPGEDRYRYVRVPEFSAMLWRLEESCAGLRARHRR